MQFEGTFFLKTYLHTIGLPLTQIKGQIIPQALTAFNPIQI